MHFERGEGMASVEVMKERARIAGRFNLSARRNPEHRVAGCARCAEGGRGVSGGSCGSRRR